MASSALSANLMTQAQSAYQSNREQQLLQQLGGGGRGTDRDAQIEKGAKEFESMLLSNWLQQAEQSMATVPGADDDYSQNMPGSSQMMGMGVQSLSTSLVASGGIGIASMIAKALHRTADQAISEAQPGVSAEKSSK